MILIGRIKRLINRYLEKRRPILKAEISQLAPVDLLNGRTAFITGGSTGIGYSIAKAMLDAGANVIIAGRSESRLLQAQERLMKECTRQKYKVSYLVLDVRDANKISEKLNEITKEERIDILVNNAGVQAGTFGITTLEEFDLVVETNLRGTYFVSQYFSKYMKDNNIKGNILNISSSSSRRPASSPYVVSKWGVNSLTLGMAKMLIPHGIVVNAIAPGPAATQMQMKDENQGIQCPNNPIGRYVTTEEIASMAVVLTSPLGRSIVGDTIYMTGGAGIITYDDVSYDF